MKLDKVANSGNNEFYTPRYAVMPLLKYIDINKKVWCPFDTERSLIVKSLQERGNNVVFTHLQYGQDFFNTNMESDIIVSNPPYSIKGEVFERLFSLQRPFAMLVGVVGLFESEKRFSMFEKHGVDIMWLNKRVAYFKSYDDEKPSLNPPFSSVWVTKGILPKSNVFERIEKSRG